MSKWLKWTIGIVTVLVVLVAGAALAVRLFLSSDQMKKLAVAQGQEFLGRQIQLQDLSIGLFSISASGLVIEGRSQVPGKKAPPLLQIKNIDILINPTALLYKQISILSLTFSDVQVDAWRDKKGQFSFQDILDRFEGKRKSRAYLFPHQNKIASIFQISEAEAAPEEDAGRSQPELDFVIRNLELQNVRVNFRSAAFNGTPDFRAACHFNAIEFDQVRLGEPLPIEMAGKCTEPGSIEFVTEGTLDPEKKTFQVTASLKPFDLMPFIRLAPPIKGLRPHGGIIGGKASVSILNENQVSWDIDWKGENLDAEFHLPERQKWQRKKLASFQFQSKGNFNLANKAAEISGLSIGLPFADVSLTEKSLWNVSGQDKIHLNVKVPDLGDAVRWAGSFLNLPLQNVKKGGSVELSLSVSRDRKEGQNFAGKSTLKLTPIEVGAYTHLLPPVLNIRRIQGKMSGEAEVALTTAMKTSWKVNLRGESLSAGGRTDSKQESPDVLLANLELRSEGTYDVFSDSAEVAQFEVKMPIGTARLTKKALWNVSGKDEAELETKISDIGAAARLATVISGLALEDKDIPKNKKFDLKLSVSRSGENSQDVSLSGSGQIDPIEIHPFVALVPASMGIRKLKGVIGGKATFSLKPQKDITWVANLSGEEVSGELDLDSDGKWHPLQVSSFKIDSAGNYNIERESALLDRLEAKLPFGTVNLLQKARWNVSGKDSIDVRWDVSDLAAAVAVARPFAEDLADIAEPDGNAKGSLQIRRDRKKSKSFAVTGSVDADLKRVHFPDRPNMAVRGKTSVKLDGKTLALTVPQFALRERKDAKAPDAAILENFQVSFSQKDLWKGQIISRRAAAQTLKLNLFMDVEKNTNLDSILKKKSQKKSWKKEATSRSRSAEKSIPKGKTTSRSQTPKRSFTGTPKGKLPSERPAKDLPVVKIDGIEIANLDLKFVHQFEKGNPPIRLGWQKLNLKVDKLDTRMRPGRLDTLVQLTGRGNPPPLTILANVNPGVDPPAMRGTVTLNQFDLRQVSPYSEQVRGMKIRKGTLDLSSKFSLRRNYLKSRSKAKVFDLELKTMRRTPLVDDAQIILQRVAISLLKRDNSEIPVSVKIEGRVDDPSFYIIRALTEALLASVFEKLANLSGKTKDLGGGLKGILKDVLKDAVGGGGTSQQTTPPSQTQPEQQQVVPAERPVIPGQSSGSSSGKRRSSDDLKDLGKEVLRGILGQ